MLDTQSLIFSVWCCGARKHPTMAHSPLETGISRLLRGLNEGISAIGALGREGDTSNSAESAEVDGANLNLNLNANTSSGEENTVNQ